MRREAADSLLFCVSPIDSDPATDASELNECVNDPVRTHQCAVCSQFFGASTNVSEQDRLCRETQPSTTPVQQDTCWEEKPRSLSTTQGKLVKALQKREDAVKIEGRLALTRTQRKSNESSSSHLREPGFGAASWRRTAHLSGSGPHLHFFAARSQSVNQLETLCHR